MPVLPAGGARMGTTVSLEMTSSGMFYQVLIGLCGLEDNFPSAPQKQVKTVFSGICVCHGAAKRPL